jgi:hypothetical protein
MKMLDKRSGSTNNYENGLADKVAYKLHKEELVESDRYYNLLDHIMYMCELAGFEINGKLELKDLETGKIWR